MRISPIDSSRGRDLFADESCVLSQIVQHCCRAVDLLGAPWVAKSGPDLANIYLHARYYDSALGIFLSPDPAGADMNAYRYGSNDPVNMLDPSGLGDHLVFPGGVSVCGRTGQTAESPEDCAWLEDEYNWNNGGWNSSFYSYFLNNNLGNPRARQARNYFERPPVVTPPIVTPPVVTPPDDGCPEGFAATGCGDDDVVDVVLGEVAENAIIDSAQKIATAVPGTPGSGCQNGWSRWGENIRINNRAAIGLIAGVAGGVETGLIGGRILVGSRIALGGTRVASAGGHVFGLSLVSGAGWSAPAFSSVAGPIGAIGLGLEIGNIIGSGISAAGHALTCRR